jgi:branched-chain amino acid aminotransferase
VYAFFKGQIVPIEEARISVRTSAFNYGTGCYEGIRAYWNDEQKQLFIFRGLAHFQRLLRSCRILMITLPFDAEQLLEVARQILEKSGFQTNTYVRPIAYKATEGIGTWLHDMEDDVTIFAQPMGKYIDADDGVKAGTVAWRRIDDLSIPARAKITGSYVNSALAKTEAHLNGYDEAIVLTQDGHVSEGSAENIFIVKNGRLITPPVTDNILEGVTRSSLMQIAAERMGVETSERSIDRTELYLADEAFFCGTSAEVSPIIEADHRPIANGKVGPITSKLRLLFMEVVQGRDERYGEWLTPVYRK